MRLRALADAPHAFGSRLTDAERLTDEDWKDRLAGRAAFVAMAGAAVVGLISGIAGEEPAEAELISMWVAPDWRRRGVGAQLVQAVIDWAVGEGFRRLHLWVAEGNTAAESLYRRLGFTSTGRSQPMGGRRSSSEFEMVKALA